MPHGAMPELDKSIRWVLQLAYTRPSLERPARPSC